MKLLIVANFAKEHINKFHLSTIKKFKDMGWQVDVACHVDADIPYCDNVYDLPCSRSPFNIGAIKSIKILKKVIKNNSYDVVHCHTLAGRVIGGLATMPFRKKGVKLFYTLHGLNYYKGSSFLSKFIMLIDKFLLKRADFVFSVSNEDLELVKRKKFISCPSCFCPISIRFEEFKKRENKEEIRKEYRNKLGLEDYTALVYVAEINKNKNQTMLLNSTEMLINKGYKIKLVLVGPDHSDGEFAKEVEKKNLKDSVVILGWRKDIYNILISCDIYVASSIREGFGLNLVEAMCCELPIVANNNRGHREIIEDGYNSFLSDENSFSDLSEKVEKIITDKDTKENFIKNGLIVFEQKFSKGCEDTIYQEYTKFFREDKNEK